METEIWKDVVGYEGIYRVSNLGNIKSLPRNGTVKYEHILIGGIDLNGYKIVRFSRNNRSTTKSFHRIVAIAFIKNPFNYPQVNHIDGCKTNSSVKNLEWCDAKYNKRHSIDILGKKRKLETYPMIPIVQKNLNGNILKLYKSVRDASRLTNINVGNISSCLTGKRKTAGKYIWKYAKI